MNVQGLVTQAIYGSLQDAQFNPDINAGYLEYGIFELNNILDEWKDFIPFAQEFTFNNVDELSQTFFVSVSNVNYVLHNVQTPLRNVSLTEFNELQNFLGLKSFPEVYYFDELKQTILIYPTPSDPTYSFTVWGRKAQYGLTEFDVLPANMPPFETNYLIHELGRRLCAHFGTPWDDEKEKTRLRLETNLQQKRDRDLTPARNIVFGRPGSQHIPGWPWFYFLSGGGN